jgi:hypothetical protein
MIFGRAATLSGLPTGTQYAFIVTSVNMGGTSPASGIATAVTDYALGDRTISGGWVFYDQGSVINGWRYMECASEDLSNGGTFQWYDGIDVPVDTGDLIGTGAANTDRILLVLGDNSYAAKACADCPLDGHDNWFLPSKDELERMYTVLKINNLGGFAETHYWTSSQTYNAHHGMVFAWSVDFHSGALEDLAMMVEMRVRPARSF